MQKKDKTHFSFLIALARQLDEALSEDAVPDTIEQLRAALAALLDIVDEGAGDVGGGLDESSDVDDLDGDDSEMARDYDALTQRLAQLEEQLAFGAARAVGRAQQRQALGKGQPADEPAASKPRRKRARK